MGEGNLSMSKLAGGAFSIMAKPAGPRCNQCCEYCFYREKDFLLSEKAKNLRMSSTVLRSYIEQMISLIQDGDEVRFTWQGGEPLLCGIDFFEEAVELQQQFKGNHSIFNALQTNGSLITTTFARFFKRNNFLIGLSLDGPESIHNYYRHGFGEVSTYQQAMHGLECLKKEGVEFNVLVTVNRVNQESPEEIYDFLKILKMVYMYNPDMEHCKMYASNKNSTNTIVFDAKKGFNVHISLNENTKVITIKILRLSDIVSKKAMGSEMSFRDGEAIISDINEENLFINIINYIMDSTVDLLKYYYKNKRRGY